MFASDGKGRRSFSFMRRAFSNNSNNHNSTNKKESPLVMDIYASKLEIDDEEDDMKDNDALHSPTTDTTVVLPLEKSQPALSIAEVTDASAEQDTTSESSEEGREEEQAEERKEERNGTTAGSVPATKKSGNGAIADSKIEVDLENKATPPVEVPSATLPAAPVHGDPSATATLRVREPVRRNHSLQNRQSKYMEEPDEDSSPPIASPLPARASFDMPRPLARTTPLARNDTLNRQSKVMLEEDEEGSGPMPPLHDPLVVGRTSLDGMMHLHQHQHHHLLQPQNSITLRCHPLSPSPSVLSPSPWHRRAPSTMSSPSRMGSMSETTLTATRYNRASYSLTNQPDALKVYRAMAEKTGDPMVQFTYAKYLLEVAALYEESDPKKKTNTKGQRATDVDMTEPGHHRKASTSLSISRTSLHSLTQKNASRTHIAHPLTTPSESQRRKKKMFEDEGVRWIKRLTKEGMGGAAFLQAQWMDEERYGFKRNRTKSRKLYQLAAKADIPEALYIVAEYDEAAGFLDHAFTRYQKAAIQGYPPALLRLAQVHLHGELHQQQNIALGLETLREASEKATDACPEAPFLFGQILTCSYAKARIPNELLYQYGGRAVGVRYFAQAAHWGYLPALVRCGHIFEHGLEGEPMDLARSFGYYDQAARVHNDPQAMLGLSRLYNRGCHGPADDSDASQREQRDVSGWLIHMERNEDGAFAWCRRAADLGHVEAIFLLGWYYETGVGVLRDYAQARTCYRRAAVKGHAGAKERLSKTNSMTRQQHEVMKASSSSQDKMCRVM